MLQYDGDIAVLYVWVHCAHLMVPNVGVRNVMHHVRGANWKPFRTMFLCAL